MLQAAAIQFMPLFDNILPVTPPLPPDKKAEPLAHYRACWRMRIVCLLKVRARGRVRIDNLCVILPEQERASQRPRGERGERQWLHPPPGSCESSPRLPLPLSHFSLLPKADGGPERFWFGSQNTLPAGLADRWMQACNHKQEQTHIQCMCYLSACFALKHAYYLSQINKLTWTSLRGKSSYLVYLSRVFKSVFTKCPLWTSLPRWGSVFDTLLLPFYRHAMWCK